MSYFSQPVDRSAAAKKAAATRARRDAEAAAAGKTTTFAVGDILDGSWGYDQTNVEFWQVVDVTPSGKSVKIRPVAQFFSRQGGASGDTVYPAKDQFTGEAETRMVTRYGYVKANEFCSLSKWSGAGRHQTAYGFGH